MQHHKPQPHLFFERGFVFEDILKTDALGGSKAIETYLQTREKMCAREIIRSATDGKDTSLLKQGMRAYDEAQEILPKLKQQKPSKAMLMALGPRELLGLK